MGMCGHQPSAPRHRSSDISAGQTEAQSKREIRPQGEFEALVSLWLVTVIFIPSSNTP